MSADAPDGPPDEQPSERGPSFWDELLRRRVVRVAIVYGAVAFAVVQVADIVVPALGLPTGLLAGIVLVALLGFPIALVLAWALEITPAGVRRTRTADQRGGLRGALVAVSGFAIALVLAVWLVPRTGGSERVVAGASSPSSDRRAIAVLPFRELAAVEDRTGMARGIHDDVLTQLSRIGGLRVTSRTSVEAYRDTDKNVRMIAAELGVGSILEGGLQRTADRVRINMQLIDAATDEHIWAQTYDRPLTAENVFAIQSEIARAVARALEAELSVEEQRGLERVPTRDLFALDLYNRARELWDAIGTENDLRALVLAEEAVRRDPEYLQAWELLARTRAWQIRTGRTLDTLPALEAALRAEATGPSSVEAAVARGYYLYYARGRYREALQSLESARAVAHGNTELDMLTAALLRRLGRWDEAIARYEQVVEREPTNGRALGGLVETLIVTGRYEGVSELLEQFPEDLRLTEWRLHQVDLLLARDGDTARARAVLEPLRDDDRAAGVLSYLAYLRRDPTQVDWALLSRPADDEPSYFSTIASASAPRPVQGAVLAWALGDPERAASYADAMMDALFRALPVAARTLPETRVGSDLFGVHASVALTRAFQNVVRGERQAALDQADRAIERFPPSYDAIDGSDLLRHRIEVRIMAGDLDGAMRDLRGMAGGPHTWSPALLGIEPLFDPLRARADFQALLADAPG